MLKYIMTNVNIQGSVEIGRMFSFTSTALQNQIVDTNFTQNNHTLYISLAKDFGLR
jgi:hypothetical protein